MSLSSKEKENFNNNIINNNTNLNQANNKYLLQFSKIIKKKLQVID